MKKQHKAMLYSFAGLSLAFVAFAILLKESLSRFLLSIISYSFDWLMSSTALAGTL